MYFKVKNEQSYYMVYGYKCRLPFKITASNVLGAYCPSDIALAFYGLILW